LDVIQYNREKELEEELKKLSKEKRKIWRLIAVGIIMPFIGPFIPMKRGTLAERMGYSNAVIMFGLIVLVAIPIGCYMQSKKINNQMFDCECELASIRRKNNEQADLESKI